MQKDEEEEQMLRERDKDRLKIKVYSHKLGDKTRSETKLVIDGETTLAEATALAHNVCMHAQFLNDEYLLLPLLPFIQIVNFVLVIFIGWSSSFGTVSPG